MQRFRHLFMIVLGGIAVFSLAACQLTIQPPTNAAAHQTLPLRNELLSRVDLVGFPELFTAPQDATPDPDGQIVYFTATGLEAPGLFQVAAAGGETTAVATGAPFVAPQGLASSMDGTLIYVADPQAANADGSLGQLFVVPAAGGEPMPLAGAAGSAPRGVEVSSENGADVIYFSGLDPSDGQPAVMKIDATGSELSIIAKGAPLVDPVGLVVTKAGVVYVADQMASGNGLGSVFQIENGTVTTIADQFRTGNPVGATLTLDESVLLVSAMAPDRDSAQVLVIELASGQQGIINKVIEANSGSGGVHRAHNVNVFAWADSTGGNPRRGGNNNRGSGESGGVYALEP